MIRLVLLRPRNPENLGAVAREALLRAAGFLAGPERHAVRDLRTTLRRARLSRREGRPRLSALVTPGREARW